MSKPIKCIIVDDEPLGIKVIKHHVEQVPGLELVATFQNALEAFELLKNQSVDLLFLDIQMPVMTGIDFAKALQNPPAIIFTTAYRNYAVESYELNAIDYLVKPITFPRFFQAVNKFIEQKKESQPVVAPPTQAAQRDAHIYVNSNKKHIKVAFQDILYIESIKDYIRIHIPNQTIITKEKISEFEQKLPGHFLRIHRSFIVNLKQVTAFTAQDVEIGEREIPIGGSYKREVLGRLR